MFSRKDNLFFVTFYDSTLHEFILTIISFNLEYVSNEHGKLQWYIYKSNLFGKRSLSCIAIRYICMQKPAELSKKSMIHVEGRYFLCLTQLSSVEWEKKVFYQRYVYKYLDIVKYVLIFVVIFFCTRWDYFCFKGV